ncbi:MAG: adenylate/guanylate cyclase domain-containing protein [Desulfobacterales bacterium]|nr:adenylate/guanylate cyclase domain-containing protein [Desulfobacterales bacterium]
MSRQRIFNRKPVLGAIAGLTGAVMAVLMMTVGWLDTWEARTWDWRVRALARPGPATADIVLVLLDQNSLDWAQKENGLSWPWPREIYGAIVDFCSRNGARALAIDVLYTEPSAYGVEDDRSFAAAVGRSGKVAGAVFLGKKSGSATAWPAPSQDSRLMLAGPDNLPARLPPETTVFSRATFPIDELVENAAVLGNVQLKPDPDGVYRRAQLFNSFADKLVPALGLGAWLAAGNRAQTTLGSDRTLKIGEHEIPVDSKGNAILRYRGPSGTHRNFSAAAVLQSEIQFRMGAPMVIADPTAFKDKFVLFGFSAPGLLDLRSAPVAGVYSGVEIHATLLDNFLSGDFFRKLPDGVTIGGALLLSLLLGLAASALRSSVAITLLSAAGVALPVGCGLVAYQTGFWLPIVVLEMAVVLTIGFTLLANYATEGRQRRFIKGAFRQYLSPAVIDQLISNPERLKLGGERKTLSIFFSDLQGFTSISEGLDPEELTALLNEYLTAMTDIVMEEGGTVDKYEGDAIIAFWNAPLDVLQHEMRTVRAALRCQAKLARMRPAIRKRIGKEMLMRIGINTGLAVVGNLGSHTRFDYTMLGDAVNLAARLEGANKQFGTFTMISEDTRRHIGPDILVRELARLAVVGRREPVIVYEPMLSEEYAGRQALYDTFEKGLALFYQGLFLEARGIFKTIQAEDPAAAAYVKKCGELADNPPENWAGVWVATTK